MKHTLRRTRLRPDISWVSVGQYFIFGALCPSKSGLMNKHIVKHIVKHITGKECRRMVYTARL